MNTYNPAIHHRRSIRLKGYDYSQAGLYFITICCQDRACLLGEIKNGELQLNDAGKMVEAQWLVLPTRFTHIDLHEFVVMPNHFHGILQITDVGAPLVVAQKHEEGNAEDMEGQPQGIAPTIAPTIASASTPTPERKTVGDMMDAFKSITTVEYIRGVKGMGWMPFNGKVWQRNYYEHIIRNEEAYQNISGYIRDNPSRWDNDKFYR
ncbi:transposase [Spirosoma foliorum]|uniref:Transposase n=1 Tax=Spirosoma foliorum TaxID=2710596 RepID=A0A7G5GVK3_9BACT|nr:transposase [Spirosoma foliorum]QMW02895.1 transposase [Spirosoma foliorum]